MKNYILQIIKFIASRDNVAKIVCIFLAVVLWFYIRNTNIGEVNFKIPVTFVNLSETLVKSRISDKYVSATLKGTKDNLKNVNIKSIKAIVDLGQPEIGINKSYPIDLIKDEVPENIDLNLSIKDVKLLVERKIVKRVKIRANIDPQIPKGFIVGKAMIIPDSVNVTGPESLLKSINFLRTEKVSIPKATGKIIKDAAINYKDNADIKIEPSKVRLIIPVVESVNSAEFTKKIILKNINYKYNYVLKQDEVLVYLESDNPNIEPSEDDIEVFIDLSSQVLADLTQESNGNYIENYYTVDTIIKNDQIRLISVFPDIISVRISLE